MHLWLNVRWLCPLQLIKHSSLISCVFIRRLLIWDRIRTLSRKRNVPIFFKTSVRCCCTSRNHAVRLDLELGPSNSHETHEDFTWWRIVENMKMWRILICVFFFLNSFRVCEKRFLSCFIIIKNRIRLLCVFKIRRVCEKLFFFLSVSFCVLLMRERERERVCV